MKRISTLYGGSNDRCRFAVVAALFLIFPGSNATAQMSNHAEQGTGGYIDRLPPATLRAGVGNSHITITTRSAEAQRFFDQGLSLLHDFWYLEAYRSFKQAVSLDPDAPMAHLGVALSLRDISSKRERADEKGEALDLARSLASDASEAEQFYIEAAWLRDSIGGSAGKTAYESKLEMLIELFPDELEAQLMLAKSAGFRSSYGRTILARAMEQHPRSHAVHHYWIHAFEWNYPERALNSAQIVSSLAPASGHITHMPGHVFYRLGEYQRAKESFLAAATIEEAYVEELGVQPTDNAMQPHNLHYLIATLAEMGQRAEADRFAMQLRDMSRAEPDRNMSSGVFTLFYQGFLGPARVKMRLGEWAEAVRYLEALPASSDESVVMAAPSAETTRGAWLEFSRGMAALSEGHPDAGERALRNLEALLWRASEDGSLNLYGGWLERRLRTAALELRGNLLSRRGLHEEAIAKLQEAVAAEEAIGISEPPYYLKPVRESLAEAQRRAGKFEDARATYRELLEERRNSGFALFGVAQAYAEEGDDRLAREAYREFLEAWETADADMPQVRIAREAL